MTKRGRTGLEWATLAMLVFCYALWCLGTTLAAALWLPLGMMLVTVGAALHSSLSHEMLHGHPFRNPVANAALVFAALTLVIPYMRFRDTHLAHHQDAVLTDPYDDPESNYLDPAVWRQLPCWVRAVLRMNNTLAGRLLIGPALGQVSFMVADWRRVRAGEHRVLIGWLAHIPAVGLVIWWFAELGQMPVWAFLMSSYAALSILKIRTFLEHQAHERARGRTVIIEDRGPLAWIFLNNNLHVVHHMHPRQPWYRLPALYRAQPDRYLSSNDGYRYASYTQIFRRHLWRAKDPVPHPLWPKP